MVFIPTYLYIKQHSITGKLYFGKTTKDPLKYKGSGKHWQNHIKQHGKEHVVTLWYQLYDNVFDLVADALSMSYSLNVVESESWLNLKIENGLDGGSMVGKYHPPMREETKILLSKVKTGIPKSEEAKKKMSDAHKGKITSIETKIKQSLAQSGELNHMYGKKLKPEEITKMVYKKSIRYDIQCPNGIILINVTRKDLEFLFGLSYSMLKYNFFRNLPYKGYSIIYKY